MKRLLRVGIGCLLAATGLRAELPEVAEEAVNALGSTYGTPQMNGFVFIEGRYVPPPYTVTRKGNGIFVNRIQIEQPVSWALFLAAAEGAVEPRKKAVDADGDFEAVAPDAAKPAAPAAPAAAPAAPAPAAPKAVKSIDDLFADDAAAAPAAAPAKAGDAEQEPAPAAAAEAAKPDAPAPAPAPAEAAPSSAVRRAPEDVRRLKEELRTKLDGVRKGYELALGRGEVFFFSERHSRLNGTYGTARTLLGVLPAALRQAQSPMDLMQRLNQGGVYFVDIAICSALYRNKMAFPLLDERLRRIEEIEALDASRREQNQTR